MSAAGTADADRLEAVLAVMRASGTVGPDARAVGLEQLQGGWSAHTWRVDVVDPQAGPLPAIVRVRQEGSLLDTSLRQEYRTYEALAGVAVPTPRLYGFCDAAETPFGGRFFVMERLPGTPPNVWRPADRERLAADWAGPRGVAEDLVAHLAAIHGVPAAAVEGILPARPFTELVAHWRSAYEAVRRVRDPIVDEAYAWVLERAPAPVDPCLVHGDYRLGNCLVDQGRVTGVLDWELAFMGDPRFDLGYLALDYNGGKFAAPGSRLVGAAAEPEWFFDRYEELSGRAADREAVRTFSALGALMLVANLSSGVDVYLGGRATDVRMLWSRFAIPGLRQDLVRLMGWERG